MDEFLRELMTSVGAGMLVFGMTMIIIGGVVNHFKLRWVARKTKELCDNVEKLVTMHEHPDDYKFGTEDTNKMLEKTLKAMDKVTEAVMALVAELKAERLKSK